MLSATGALDGNDFLAAGSSLFSSFISHLSSLSGSIEPRLLPPDSGDRRPAQHRGTFHVFRMSVNEQHVERAVVTDEVGPDRIIGVRRLAGVDLIRRFIAVADLSDRGRRPHRVTAVEMPVIGYCPDAFGFCRGVQSLPRIRYGGDSKHCRTERPGRNRFAGRFGKARQCHGKHSGRFRAFRCSGKRDFFSPGP